MKVDEVELDKEYWFFLLTLSNNTGRVIRRDDIRKVKVLAFKRSGYSSESKWIVDATDPSIILYSLCYSSANGLYKTYDEAKTEWNRIIEDGIDCVKSRYEKILKNLKNKRIE